MKIVATCHDILIVNHQMGKDQMALTTGLRVLTGNLHKSGLTAQIDGTGRGDNGGVPIELRTGKTVGLGIVGKGLQMGVIDRQTVLRRNPQPTVSVLHNTLHGIVHKSVLLRQHLKTLLTILTHNPAIQTIAIATQPKGTVTTLTERGDLLIDMGIGVI